MCDPFIQAEYITLGDAVKESLFFRQGCVAFHLVPGKGMPCFMVFEDNQGAVKLAAQNPVTNLDSKHIDERHSFLRELVYDVFVAHRKCPMDLSE